MSNLLAVAASKYVHYKVQCSAVLVFFTDKIPVLRLKFSCGIA